MAPWCRNNSLTLNTKKSNELIVDLRKEKLIARSCECIPIHINGLEVEQMSAFK